MTKICRIKLSNLQKIMSEQTSNNELGSKLWDIIKKNRENAPPITSIVDPNTFNENSALKIQDSINAPFSRVNISTLGGKERASLLITISLDPREEWANGIIENSRLTRFHLSHDGILDQFHRFSRPVKPFRKTRVKSIDDAIVKINTYLKAIT